MPIISSTSTTAPQERMCWNKHTNKIESRESTCYGGSQMTTNRKNELIAQLVSILSELIEANDSDQVAEVKSDAMEMLTVKECTEAVRGLSEHTVRKLIKQGKLPYLRTGDGVNGKMLINKAGLLAYFNGQTANR